MYELNNFPKPAIIYITTPQELDPQAFGLVLEKNKHKETMKLKATLKGISSRGKKFLLILVTTLSLILTSCTYDDGCDTAHAHGNQLKLKAVVASTR